ncbi:MAG: PorT family protein [Cyclobacteriaceae bacterium]
MNLSLSKSLILVFLTFFTCWNVVAQASFFGLKGGYNISSLSSSGQSKIKLEDRNAFNVAGVISFREWQSKWGFSLEPGYTLKGTLTNADTLDYRFHYLTLPLLVDCYPIKRLKISAGPEISYLVSTKNKVNDTIKVNLLNTYGNRLEFSATIGAAYELDYFVDIGIRYNASLTKISDFDPELGMKNLRNQYFQVYLLFKIAN